MKHILIILATATLFACKGQKYAANDTTTGQDTLTYAANGTQALTQKDVQFFNRVCEAYGGLQYTPVWFTSAEDSDGTQLSYFCKGQNGKNVMVMIHRPTRGKPVITDIKQMSKPKRPTDVLTIFYDSSTGSAPLDAVLSAQNCEVLRRDAEMCSVTVRLSKGETRALIENTKGVISVAEHQMMQH